MHVQFMPSVLPLLAATLLVALLQGCATLNKEECQVANWRSIGFEDGSRGYPAARVGSHRSACAEYGVAPDLAAYTAGHEQGLQLFCTPRNGYQTGLRGQTYNNLCPQQFEQAFREGNDYGLSVYQLERDLRQLQQSDQATSTELAGLDQKIEVINVKLSNQDQHAQQNLAIESEIRQLQARYQSLQVQSAQYLSMQPQQRRAISFEQHLLHDDNEYRRQNLQHYQHIIEQFQLNPAQRDQLTTIFTSAQQRGSYHELQAWLELSTEDVPPQLDRKMHVQHKLRDASEAANQAEANLFRQMHNPALRISVNQLKSEQEFYGALSLHIDVFNTHQRPQTLNQLINLHFTTAQLAIDNRIALLQGRIHRHAGNPASQIHRDLAQLEDQKEILQFNLREMRLEQQRVQAQIRTLRASSPFR